jgi:hypothetical protein
MKLVLKSSLAVILLIFVATAGIFFSVYQQAKLIDVALESVHAQDDEIKEEEKQFLAKSSQLLAQNEEFVKSITEFSNFTGEENDRQRRFVWLSGNVMSQLFVEAKPASEIAPLERHLNKRSRLVRDFEQRFVTYQSLCAAGWRASFVRMLGRCHDVATELTANPPATPPSREGNVFPQSAE